MKSKKLDEVGLLEVGNSIQMCGILLSGQGQTFLAPLPDIDIEKLVHLDMSRGDWIRFLRQTDIQETKVLMQDGEGFKKAILRKSARQVDSRIMWEVFRRDGYMCRYCGRGDVPLTVDHVVLWEEGGPTIEENLVTACKRCNKKRGNTPYEEWLDSKDYQDSAVNLTSCTLVFNRQLVETLVDIPLRVHIPSRGKKKKGKG